MSRESWPTIVSVAIAATVMATAGADAHVRLDAPNGGEILMAGTTTTVEWHIQIEHPLENWDLWYSLEGPNGPWLEIATDLPPGDPSIGSIHTFEWLVPDAPSSTVRVRVRQDNTGIDYEDISDGDLTILAAPLFADGFESGDLGGWSTAVP